MPMITTSGDPILLDFPHELETERLLVRCPRPGDGIYVHRAISASIAELRRWPSSLAWALGEQTPETAEIWCRLSFANFASRTDLQLLIWTKHEGNCSPGWLQVAGVGSKVLLRS